MKKLLVVLCFPVVLSAQIVTGILEPLGTGEKSEYLWSVNDTSGSTLRIDSVLYNRTFTSIVADTTQAIYTIRGKSLWVHVAAKDSCTILTKYQLSQDGLTWMAAVPLDSVKVAAQSYFIKSYNLSTPADSARFIRLLLPFSVSAYAKGTTTPTYSVTYAIKRD